MKNTLVFILALIILACGSDPKQEASVASSSWEEIIQLAKGQEVTMMMWQGDPLINAYMSRYVVQEVAKQYGVTLKIVPGQGSQIVSLTLAEKSAGKASSEIDMCWLNGETFFQMREIDGLYGPFVQQLPNSQYINWENPFIKYDFQQEVNDMECPWGNVQMALIYHSGKVPTPPQTLEELETWVKANPGKFSIGADFTGMTLLKSWMIALSGDSLKGSFSEEKYQEYAPKLWIYLRRIKPYLWNKGESFPNDVAQMHQLFASGELWFTMSNNDAEVDNKIAQGMFAPSTRAYIPAYGTVQNSHYMGILKNAPHKAAAMAVCNFLISPEAQLKKMMPDTWGDGTVLSAAKLPAEWKEKFANVPGRKYAPPRTDIQKNALMEPAPEYMLRLFDDFKKEMER